jgi:hypothetical protein
MQVRAFQGGGSAMTLAPSAYAFLAALLVRSAWAKIRRPEVFQTILEAYPFGSRLRVLHAARLAPAVELVLAGALALPVPAARLFGGCGTIAFIIFASAAIYVRYLRGEKRFACGCSGNLEEQTDASGMLIRNGLLLLVTAYALAGYARASSPVDYGLGLALLLAFDLSHTALQWEGRVRNWKGLGSDPT